MKTWYLSQIHQQSGLKATLICDNKGVVKGCSNNKGNCLQQHRQANMDLYLVQHKGFS